MNSIPFNTSFVSGVAIANFGQETKLLLLKRANEGFWCHIAGKIKETETAWQAIVRDFHEETGIIVEDLYSADYLEQFYYPVRNCISVIPVFVVEISSGTKIELNEEHTDYRWCSLEEAKSFVPFPNQRLVYEHVWSNFVIRKPSDLLRVKRS